MTREKKKGGALPALGTAAKHRHDKHARSLQHDSRIWTRLNPLKQPAQIKHKSYFEAVENADKKKKLEFEITTGTTPMPGFEFVPIGNPELTQACKDLSREQEAMIYIVSDSKNTKSLDHHMHRLGYHFRQAIVDQARAQSAVDDASRTRPPSSIHRKPESIPTSQEEIDRQADAVLRDLFPRIPNTDRHQIILHAFEKNGKFNGGLKIGMATNLTLARRVQLAALAHIRHNHTRYDELLRESDWSNARKAVEQPCLDIIVKWRGDEETGRDQLDEILREVIEISDNEEDSEDESSGEDTAPEASSVVPNIVGKSSQRYPSPSQEVILLESSPAANSPSPGLGKPLAPKQAKKATRKERRKANKAAKNARKRFSRYEAVAQAITAAPQTPSPVPDASHGAFMASAMSRTQSLNAQMSADPARAVDRYGTPPRQDAVRSHQPSPYQGATFFNGNAEEVSHLNTPPFRLRQDPPHRGLSPVLVRVGGSHVPSPGPAPGRQDAVRTSPIQLGLQDMLVDSIEPHSPVIVRDPARLPSLPARDPEEPNRISRMLPRTVVREPASYVAGPASPGFAPGPAYGSRPAPLGSGHRTGNQDAFLRRLDFRHEHADERNHHRSGVHEYRSDIPFDGAQRPPTIVRRAQPPPGYREVSYYDLDEPMHRSRANPIVIESPPRVDRASARRYEPYPSRPTQAPLRIAATRMDHFRGEHAHSDGRRITYVDSDDQEIARPHELHGNRITRVESGHPSASEAQVTELARQSAVISQGRVISEDNRNSRSEAPHRFLDPVSAQGEMSGRLVERSQDVEPAIFYRASEGSQPSLIAYGNSSARPTSHYGDDHLPAQRFDPRQTVVYEAAHRVPVRLGPNGYVESVPPELYGQRAVPQRHSPQQYDHGMQNW